MECPSCSFQNMPGSARCARCGAMLSFAAGAIDVHPPRATAMGKALFGWWRPSVLWRRFTRLLSAELLPARARVFENAHLDLATVLRSIIPGWANAHTGHWLIGLAFLVCYLALLI